MAACFDAANCRAPELEAEIERLRGMVVSFCAVWAVPYAKDRGLPEGHLFPEHYDILKECGARMDSFVRADIAQPEKAEGE